MRLDHLLSKEHLPPNGGKGARGPRLVGRGARWRRHWRVSYRQRPAGLVRPGIAPSSGWCAHGSGTSGWCGWWRATGTLLGPERTTVPGPRVGAGRLRAGWSGEGLLFRCQAQPGLHTVPSWVGQLWLPGSGWGLVWAWGLWVGRWLRIAQWTRASCFLWLSCQGRTVDALVPGADEGRGRPR